MLREPLQYLSSKYVRACGLRAARGIDFIGPAQFIFNQAHGESINPGSSALSTASHKTLIEHLGKTASIHAVGFRELVSSSNTLKSLRLTEDHCVGFVDLPKENDSSGYLTSLNLKKMGLTSVSIHRTITNALERVGWLEKLLSNQMYD